MRLHVKLTLILLGSLICLLVVAQTWQVRRQVGQLQQQSDRAVELLAERELVNAHNVALAAEQAVAGSLERGEMSKFQDALDDQRKIEGLLEFSLYGRNREIAYSTDAGRIGDPLDPALLEAETAAGEGQHVRTHDDRLEILVPQEIDADCVRCHVDWPRSGFGGALYFQFSRDAVVTAKQAATETMAEAESRATRDAIVLIAVLGGVLGLLVHWFLGLPLSRFVGMLDHFRTDPSDLTYRIPVTRRDEIGRLAETLNHFLEQVHDIVRRSMTGAERVVEHSSAISTISEDLVREMTAQRDRTNQIAGSTEEMAATSQDVAKQSAEAARFAEETGSQAERGEQVVGDALGSMRELAELVKESSTSVNELGERSRSITGVVELIEAIAGQTNLLALNATIEAARAGEHGRGFAVVAEEVRALAQRTQEATEDITRSIAEMQSVTERSMSRMSEGAQKAGEVATLAEEAGGVLGHILSGTSRVGASIQEIAAAAEEQSTVTKDIASNIDSIEGSARSSAEAATQTAERVRSLESEADELVRSISQFQV